MVFSSRTFLFEFLVPFLLVYLLTPRRWRNATLSVGSLVFYGWWRPDFLGLVLFSSVADYAFGGRIQAARDRGKRGHLWLTASLVTNLGLLGWFKYANLFADTFASWMISNGEAPPSWERVVLPVGISFYTFQTMSYSIDIWRGKARPARRFLDFLCYVTMFPQLVAGPIVRWISLEKQLQERRTDLRSFGQGAVLLQIGLAKKLLIADLIAPVADRAFMVEGRSVLEAWAGLFSYSFQIYFDFSGYSDIALGLGLLLGFRLPINFDRPYRSRSITEFWRRWHITLSSWLRDYLYVPLGGNRKGRVRTYLNLMLVMLLGGLWHGPSWTFVAWGATHGFLLGFERLRTDRGHRPPEAGWWPMARTFLLVTLAWVFFRAADFEAASNYFASLVGMAAAEAWQPVPIAPLSWLVLLIAGLVAWAAPVSHDLARRQPRWLLVLLPMLSALTLARLFAQDHVPFLYFQF